MIVMIGHDLFINDPDKDFLLRRNGREGIRLIFDFCCAEMERKNADYHDCHDWS
jgi:hypothetical protein